MPTDTTAPTLKVHINGSLPMMWDGTEAQKKANQDSHRFFSYDPDECPRCDGCDCRMGSISSDWPCGQPVPREDNYWVEVVE